MTRKFPPAAFLSAAPLLFVLLWSTGFLGTKGAARNADPFAYLTVRFALAALLMLALTAALRAPWPTRAQAGRAGVTGLLLHAGYLGGVTTAIWLGLPAGVTSVLVGVQPLLTGLLSWPVLGERVTRPQWAGLTLGFVGVLLVVEGRVGGGVGSPAALGAAAFALICTTAGTLYQRRVGADMPLLGGTAAQYVVSAAALGAVTLARGGGVIHWNAEFILSLTWLVLVLSVGAILLLMRLLRDLPAARVNSLFYLVPPLAVLESWALYGERLSALSLGGLLLCVTGVALAARQPATRPARTG
ncbi:peptide ABC transporter ATP-binding protein [Deinococcus seoulensis]|uniref:Peptide ABC transporter ATP-binding protein n=1 Tax=Deinococcus seoulensis TaxID=1837379 RepID=A0ABQ2RTA6_9DEIO|nr:EamA family transporter [Deinococcus seoulensis]GGR52812.1 peptide ABC transporter ATP-binding protein [Deinococcus seoulensis]